MPLFLVRFGEIGIKSDPVRRRFLDTLITNIENAFIGEQEECSVHSDRGHIYIRADRSDVATGILSRAFGVVSFSPVERVETDIDAICSFLEDWSRDKIGDGANFAIRSRRTGNHDFTSRDVAIRTGDAVRLANEDRNVGVDLDDPDTEIFVEVRDNRTYIYTEKIDGPGGLPYGTQGKVVALIGSRASALACWLLMRRGCKVVLVQVGEGTEVEMAMKTLDRWSPRGVLDRGPSLISLDEENIERAIDFAWSNRSSALVVGEKDSLFEKRDFPIFYPLVGLPEDMIHDLDSLVFQ